MKKIITSLIVSLLTVVSIEAKEVVLYKELEPLKKNIASNTTQIEIINTTVEGIESTIESITNNFQNIQAAIDYDTEVGTIQYEERDGELWVTSAASSGGILKIPAYKDGKKIRGIKYNALFDAEEFYFLGTDLEVLKHETNINGQVVLDYYEHPNWQDVAMRIYMPNVKEIPPWYFMSLPGITDYHNIYYFYGPNVERIGDYAFAGTYLGEDEGYGYTSIEFPSLKFVGANAFMNTPAKDVYVPELLEMDASTFGSEVTNLYAPKVRIVRGISSGSSTNNPNFRLPYQTNSCFKNIEHVYLPSCEEIGNNVFHFEDAVDTLTKPKTIYMPKCKRVGTDNWFFNVTELVMPECYDWNGRFITGVDIEHPTNYFKIKNSNPPRYDPTKDHQIRKSPSEFEPNTILRYVNLGTRTLEDNAFRSCEEIQVVELPNLEIGARRAFQGCKNLVYVDAPKMVHGAECMFFNCNKLGSINMPELVDVPDRMFSGCTQIHAVRGTSPRFKPRKGWFMIPTLMNDHGNWVWRGSTNIVMPDDWIIPESESDRATLVWYKPLEKVLSKIHLGLYIPKVTYIGHEAFRAYDPDDYEPPEEGEEDGEWKLSTGNIGVIDLPNVIKIGPSAFRGQRRLDTLNIPNCEVIDEAAFQRAGASLEIDENGIWDSAYRIGQDNVVRLDSVKQIKQRAFAKAWFGRIANPDNSDDWWQDESCWRWHGVQIYAPNVTYIAPDAFYEAKKILEVYAPQWHPEFSLDYYLQDNYWSIKYDPSIPESIWKSSVTNVVYAGKKYDYLTNDVYAILLDISKNGGLVVDGIDYQLVLKKKRNIEETILYFDNGTTIVTNIVGAFNNTWSEMSELVKVEIGTNVTDITMRAFDECTNLTSISIPNSVTNIDGFAFIRCYNLTNIVLPNSLKSFGGGIFSYCSSLVNVNIPKSVPYVSHLMFSGCSSIQEINVPNNIEIIGGSAFEDCTNLKSIIIGSRVSEISGSDTFKGCSNLKSITFKGKTKAQVLAMENYENWNIPNGVKIICIDGSFTYENNE